MSRRIGGRAAGRPGGRATHGTPALRPGYAASPTGDPFAGVERVYIDGNNLLYALARGGPPGPAGAVVGRIRAAFPPSVVVDLVFDGPPAGGIKGRLATGLRVAYSGRLSADQVIDDGVGAQLAADGPAGTWGILVVTDDRGLREAVGAKGARTAGAAWLAGRLGRLSVDAPAPSGGGGRGAGSGAAGGRGRGPGGAGGTGGAPSGAPGQRSHRRAAPGTVVPLPKAGTTFGHRRPPRGPAPDPD
jgi:hypothetical protein